MSAVVGYDIHPVGEVAGAEVLGLDLNEPLEPPAVDAIRQALVQHHILIFRNQTLAKEAQLAFSEKLGDLEGHVIRLRDGEKAPLLHVISNLDADGNPTSKPYSHGNYYWHTDKSYHDVPSFATLLHAVELPPSGGDTEYANMHLAYDALPDSRKTEIASLKLEHSWEASRLNTGNRPATEAEKRDRPPVQHPLVRTHPETGRKGLYLGMHVSHVLGMPAEESRALLDDLQSFATEEQFVYKHAWQPGDLVVWDNRSLLHRASANYDMDRYRRVLHRTVIRGTVPF
ncbi:MAG: TauD/TfdA family dioxygenase [Pseudomonadota bacterium]